MGAFTGKILDFDTRCKSCRICNSAAKKGQKPRTHECRKNHVGSSKSMEPKSTKVTRKVSMMLVPLSESDFLLG